MCRANETISTAIGTATAKLSYSLYLHRSELNRRRGGHFMRLSHTKINLTDGLIQRTVQNIERCSAEDLQTLSREMIFKKKLKMQVQRLKNLHRLWKARQAAMQAARTKANMLDSEEASSQAMAEEEVEQ